LKDQADGFDEAIPTGGFGFKGFAAFARETVELGFAAGVGGSPLGGEEPAIFEAVKGGVEGAFGGLDYAAGDLL
jgi:hypothetical protein